MAKGNFRNAMRSILYGLAILAVIFLYGGSAAIYGSTLVEWYVPAAMAVILAAASLVALRGVWQRMFPDLHIALIYAGHIAAFTGLFLFMILGLNYFFADKSSAHIEKTVIENRYREKHYRSKRVTRKHYTRGEPYYEYYVTARFSDGRKKELSMPLKRYRNIHKGDTMEIEMSDGLLGMPVIKRDYLRVDVPPRPKNRGL